MNETLLHLIIWFCTGIFLGFKWAQVDKSDTDGSRIFLLSIVCAPVVLAIAFIRQFIIEEWR